MLGKKKTFCGRKRRPASPQSLGPNEVALESRMGKFISFTLAFPGTKFYIRKALTIGSAAGKPNAPLSPLLREELEFWRFLDSWTDHIPWRKDEHVALKVITDASQSR